MKRIVLPALIAVALLAPRCCPAQQGGTFDLSWSTLGAGGGRSGGSGITLSGVVASWDAGQSSGGGFSLRGGWGGPLGTVAAPAPRVPEAFEWLPVRPNPFTQRTAIGFALPRSMDVTVAAYDVRGRRVRTLVAERLAPGLHHLAWDGTDDRGAPLPSGIYFVRIAGGVDATARVVLVH